MSESFPKTFEESQDKALHPDIIVDDDYTGLSPYPLGDHRREPKIGNFEFDFDNQNWRDRAECKDSNRDLFFSTIPEDHAAAKSICDSCSVKSECYDYALNFPEWVGTWGGVWFYQHKPRPAGPKNI